LKAFSSRNNFIIIGANGKDDHATKVTGCAADTTLFDGVGQIRGAAGTGMEVDAGNDVDGNVDEVGYVGKN
jgi:hypothetical protein